MDTSQNQYIENFEMDGNWSLQSEVLKKLFPQLKDEDLRFEKGKIDELLSRLEVRLNKKRGEIITIIKKGQPEFNSNQKRTENF
jgi:hypothetical protein